MAPPEPPNWSHYPGFSQQLQAPVQTGGYQYYQRFGHSPYHQPYSNTKTDTNTQPFNQTYQQPTYASSLCPPPPPPPPPSLRPPQTIAPASTANNEYSLNYGQPAKRQRPGWHCDICNIDLDSAVALEAHRKSHQKCSKCDYVASPKLVKAHYQAKHGKFCGSGFKTITVAIPGCPVQRFKICVGNDPDDIQKWIAERKKRFPRRRPTTKPPQALASLLDGYGSSSEEEEEEKAETVNTAVKLNPNPNSTSSTNSATVNSPSARICRYFARNGQCKNGDACPFRHEMPTKRATRRNKPNTTSSSTTLLRKLLQKDADRETTLTLQLVRYLVESDYLKEPLRRKGEAS